MSAEPTAGFAARVAAAIFAGEAMILLMVALGGRGTLFGATIGAAVIVLLKNLVSVYTQRWLLILGIVYIGTIRFAPDGIVGALRAWRRWSGLGPRRVPA